MYQNIDQMAEFNSAKCDNFLAQLYSFILKLLDLAHFFKPKKNRTIKNFKPLLK